MRSPIRNAMAAAQRGTRHEARLGRSRASGDRRRAPHRATARSGPAISRATRVGASARRKNSTVRTRSSSCTICSGPVSVRAARAAAPRAPEQRAAAVGLPPHDHRRPQDHPVEVARHQRLVAGELAAGEGGGSAIAVDADRRDLHHAPHARLLAGRKQRGGARRRARRPWSRAGPSCSTPAQLTTASMPARCGSQSDGLGRLGDVERDAAGRLRQHWLAPAPRAIATTSCPSPASPASTARPIRPVAPVSSTRKSAPVVDPAMPAGTLRPAAAWHHPSSGHHKPIAATALCA